MELPETTPETAAALKRKRRANLRPYQRGQSGLEVRSRRYLAQQANVLASVGVHDVAELSGIDRIAVDQITQQLLRSERAKDHDEAARCSREARQWLKDLQARRAKAASGSTLGDILKGASHG